MENINNIYWGIPFCLLLLVLTIAPIVITEIWQKHLGKIMVGLSLSLILPYYYFYGAEPARYFLLECITHDYIPFLSVVGALYIVSSNINIILPYGGKPLSNTIILLCGTFLSSIMGTMGASSILIRPLIEVNKHRRYIAHIFIFFIFLISNIGGCFSTLGDPPIFLGYINGLPFSWATINLFAPTICVTSILLTIFYIYESFVYKYETTVSELPKKFILQGGWNILLAILIPIVLLMTELSHIDTSFKIQEVEVGLKNIIRDIALIVIGLISYFFTKNPKEDYLEPIKELSKVFFGVIVTIYPLMAMFKNGKNGPFADVMNLLDNGIITKNESYFWLSGIFSVLLDNAPTYLVFFSSLGASPEVLSTSMSKTLVAISISSVYFGALSYIGNSPNYMVKSVLEQYNIKMPGFFTYILIACVILLPIFALVSKIFI